MKSLLIFGFLFVAQVGFSQEEDPLDYVFPIMDKSGCDDECLYYEHYCYSWCWRNEHPTKVVVIKFSWDEEERLFLKGMEPEKKIKRGEHWNMMIYPNRCKCIITTEQYSFDEGFAKINKVNIEIADAWWTQ